MTIYIVVREDQNEHGYVDTSIIAAFTDAQMAEVRVNGLEAEALRAGERVEGRGDEWSSEDDETDWSVSFEVQETTLHIAPEVLR
jgi:hypothetical protein